MAFPDSGRVRAILLDIEGTTTPATYVYDVLFPYAAHKLNHFIRNHFLDTQIRPYLAELKEHRLGNADASLPAWRSSSAEDEIASLAAYAQWLMQQDSKLTPLKALQGKIWEEGYARGELHGQVYPDVPPALHRWGEQRKLIYIYSSGSELAQRLLFQSTKYGDLSLLLHGFFDTRVGPKTDARSYREISSRMSCVSNEVLFVSDSTRELEAARSAGMYAALVMRSLGSGVGSAAFATIRSFDELFPE